MRLGVNLLQALNTDVRVDLRGVEAFVAEKQLQRT
jgi:hypothetical protein